MPCPETSTSFMRGRALPHDASSYAHTPSRLESHKSTASRELSATLMMDGLRCMQSSSGNAPPVDDVEALEEAEPLRLRLGLSEARSRAVVGSEPCLCKRCGGGEGESGGVRVNDMNSYRPLLPLPPGTLLLRALLALTGFGDGIVDNYVA